MQSRQRKQNNNTSNINNNQDNDSHFKDFSESEFIEEMLDVQEKVYELERTVKNILLAFTLNDLGHPDTDGHRRTHLNLNKQKEIMDSYKVDVTKKILGAIAVFLLGLLSTGFLTNLKTWFH
jgi:hypothetical protein